MSYFCFLGSPNGTSQLYPSFLHLPAIVQWGEPRFVQEDLVSHQCSPLRPSCVSRTKSHECSPQDLLLFYERTLWLFSIVYTIFVRHKVPQSLWKVLFNLEVCLVAVCKLWNPCEVSSTVQFVMHVSLSICIYLVSDASAWCPAPFSCALRQRLNVSLRNLFQKSHDLPDVSRLDATNAHTKHTDVHTKMKMTCSSESTLVGKRFWKDPKGWFYLSKNSLQSYYQLVFWYMETHVLMAINNHYMMAVFIDGNTWVCLCSVFLYGDSDMWLSPWHASRRHPHSQMSVLWQKIFFWRYNPKIRILVGGFKHLILRSWYSCSCVLIVH